MEDNGNRPVDDDRRQGDRRKSQQTYEGPDRRQSDRRSGKDRRKTARN